MEWAVSLTIMEQAFQDSPDFSPVFHVLGVDSYEGKNTVPVARGFYRSSVQSSSVSLQL